MTVTHLFDYQVDALVAAVDRLARSNGQDTAAKEAVRKQVAGELMNHGRLQVVSSALAELHGEPGCDLLRKIIAHHRETFYLPDRTLAAVVVPIRVRFRSYGKGDFQVAEMRPETVDGMACTVAQVVGSKKVVFDTRLYEGTEVFYFKPHRMLSFLEKLEAGERCPEDGPTPTVIHSSAEPDWRVVYLLGVEVNEPGATLAMNTDEAQRRLMEHRCHAEWALTEASGLMIFNSATTADARCLGFWYANRGVLEGDTWLRGAQLYALVNGFDQGIGEVKFRYARDETNGHVRLLITSDQMTVEHRWKLFAGEGIDGFLQELDIVIARLVAADTALVKEEVHLYDYEKIARQAGLVWVGGE
jgi:hypothetical protein